MSEENTQGDGASTEAKPEPIVDGPKPETVDHVVTQEDLDNNQGLVEHGVQVGETIQIAKTTEGLSIVEAIENETPEDSDKKKALRQTLRAYIKQNPLKAESEKDDLLRQLNDCE